VIRTSGERRVSNFLLWQAAYAEYLFPEVLWPDFGAVHFASALADFAGRVRRYGARPDE
jgi:undecaprenyl diphosphate synthase